MLRLRLIEELEAPHRQQMSAIETVTASISKPNKPKELNKFRKLYYQYRRELEVSKSDMELQQQENEKLIKEFQERETILQNSFNARVAELNAELESNTDPDRIRALTAEKYQHEQNERQLRQEVDELRYSLENVIN